jgi:ubiquinone biosynthesis protein
MSEQLGARALWRNIRTSAPEWSKVMPALPLLAHEFLEQATTGQLQVEWTSAELVRLREELHTANRRRYATTAGTGLLLAAAIIYDLDGHAPALVLGAPWLSWLLGAAGVMLLLAGWPRGNRQRRSRS